MNTTHSDTVSPARRRPTVVHTLAHLLEHMERGRIPVAADPYRSVARHLVAEFETVQPGPALDAVLDSHPAAAELYENVKYRHAGLCRSPLEPALAAELRARDAIQKARHTSGFNKGGIPSGKN